MLTLVFVLDVGFCLYWCLMFGILWFHYWWCSVCLLCYLTWTCCCLVCLLVIWFGGLDLGVCLWAVYGISLFRFWGVGFSSIALIWIAGLVCLLVFDYCSIGVLDLFLVCCFFCVCLLWLWVVAIGFGFLLFGFLAFAIFGIDVFMFVVTVW